MKTYTDEEKDAIVAAATEVDEYVKPLPLRGEPFLQLRAALGGGLVEVPTNTKAQMLRRLADELESAA